MKSYSLHFEPFNTLTGPFFNCGVMVIDNKKWIANDIPNRCLDVLKTYRHTDHWKKDEPAFNAVLKDEWFHLDERWNYHPRNTYKKAYITHYYGQRINYKPDHDAF